MFETFASILIHIFCYDIWFYIFHILLHNKNIYFIHKLHHFKKHNELTFLDAYHGDLIELPIQTAGIFLPYLVVQVSIEPLLFTYIYVAIRGFMKHEPRLCWLIGNHHLLHHKYPKYNFGEYWLDYCFGTTCPHKREYIYGIIHY
jgi:sterol desaturase/sphingolipid hydroxylase (fatty acid hydroxylase superfamily)